MLMSGNQTKSLANFVIEATLDCMFIADIRLGLSDSWVIVNVDRSATNATLT